ncbi:hypothetical protein IQ07DRAFT_590496 [Pyrenochaeta sp. DS3sAY3a]|nr:hypothetical protein IQ07DRAFT_590496 [Pyrenochaeta sp. DS3sAY3a]
MSTSLSTLTLDTEVTGDNNASLDVTVRALIERGKNLHAEVEAYVAAVLAKSKDAKVQNPVEYRNLRNDMKNELAFLEKIAGSNMDEEKARHYIVSSNLLYYEALWSAAKRTSGLQSFRKYFFWNRHTAPGGKHTINGLSLAKGSQKKGKPAALVDIVAEEGMQWIRVSTLSEKRLLFDLAKLGWMNDSDSDSDDDMLDAPANNWEDDDDDDQVDVVRNARELARAAKANPIRGRPPKVLFVLTRIVAGKTHAVDMILDKIRETGAVIQCANDIPPPVPLHTVLPQLLIDRSRALSDTLNIDCTILLALISDISHKPCPILDWYPGEVRAQINEEAQEHLLPTHLYPAIGSHPMVCTQDAADQMNLIVETLATDLEKQRADILLAQGARANYSTEDLVAEWASISDHAVPAGFRLPIQPATVDLDTITDGLPAVAVKVAAELGPLNKSIFLFGWRKGLTTLSANRGRARQIDSIINDHGLNDGEAGPHVWLCGESRSLIAKHGRRR